MEKKVKKKKKKKRNYGRLLVVSIIALYFLSRVFPIIGTNSQETVVTEFGKIENSITTTGYIAREEKVFTNSGNGEAKYFVAEGEKVSKGQKLAEIYLENLDEKYVKDLEIINHRIETMKDKQEEKPFFERDLTKLDNEINGLLQKIQKDIQQGVYDNLPTYKKSLKELAQKQNVITGEKSFSGRSLSQLQEEKAAIESKIKTSLQVIKSDYPGFIAFGQDGFESVLNLTAIEAIKVGELETVKKNLAKPKPKQEDSSVLRIINSHRWSILFEIDAKKAEEIKEGQKIILRKQGEGREYSARVRKIIVEEEKGLVILDLTDLMEGFYQTRTIDIDIIINRHEGVMIPNKAIVEKDQQKGVYRVDVNGFVKFIPVKAKGSNREFTVVHDGTFEETQTVIKDGKEEKKAVKVNTVKLYDEVVLKGDKVSEGQRVR